MKSQRRQPWGHSKDPPIRSAHCSQLLWPQGSWGSSNSCCWRAECQQVPSSAAVCCVPAAIHSLLSAGCWLPCVICWLLCASCCLPSAICRLLSAVCHLLSAVCRLPSTVCCLLSAICCLLSAICCLLYAVLPSAICHLPSAICCLLSAVCCSTICRLSSAVCCSAQCCWCEGYNSHQVLRSRHWRIKPRTASPV